MLTRTIRTGLSPGPSSGWGRALPSMHRLLRLLPAHLVIALVTSAAVMTAAGREIAQEPSDSPDQRIDRLIEQLGDGSYFVRERAQAELAELGFDAYDALLAASTHDDLEIAARATYLLRLIAAQWSVEDEPEPVRRYLTYYRSQPTSPEVRIWALQILAHLPDGMGIPAMGRLVRFEKSPAWSKHAAVAILDGEPVDRAGKARWAKQLRKRLGRSARPAVQWLHAYLALREDPKTALAGWGKLVEEERAVLQRSPDQSNRRIVASLLYHLAMAQADQDDQPSAEKTAAEASETISGRTRWLLDAHLDAAFLLARRGRFQWAEREYRQVIDADSPEWAARARLALSEMLHDQADDLRAADVLDALGQLEDQELALILRRLSQTVGLERTVQAVRARTDFFYACHCQKQGDPAKQRKYLDQAVQHDPAELDALIDRYQLPNREPEHHQKTLQLIREVADGLRQKIAKFPSSPRHYNEFAWLIGNTEGDLDEALRYARKAVELRPNRGDFLDTLAHVHFARGDLQNAVKYETRAAQFEPHSGLIVRKLEFFRHAMEEKTKAAKEKPLKRPDQREGTQDEAAQSQRD